MEEWYKEVGQLQVQVASIPQQTQIKETVAERQAVVEARMVRLIEPLKERRRILLASKEVHQVGRDLEDEIVSRRPIHTHTFPSLILTIITTCLTPTLTHNLNFFMLQPGRLMDLLLSLICSIKNMT